MSVKPVTITITGAGGQLGYALLFRIASGAMLGDVPVRLHLLEMPQAIAAAEGTAFELADRRLPVARDVDVFDDPSAAFEGRTSRCSSVLALASPGWSGRTCSRRTAASSGRRAGRSTTTPPTTYGCVVVGNPANTNALIASAHAPDVPADRFTAMTRLDHNRALAQLAPTVGTPVGDFAT